MKMKDYKRTITVSSPTDETFGDILGRIKEWWTDDFNIEGNQLTVRFGDTCKTFLVEWTNEPLQQIWTCTDANLIHDDVDRPDEWVGTRIVWTVEPDGNGTDVTLVHEGLTSDLTCHEICVAGWDHFFAGSFASLLRGGSGSPYLKGNS